jgi:hypothetical protein
MNPYGLVMKKSLNKSSKNRIKGITIIDPLLLVRAYNHETEFEILCLA